MKELLDIFGIGALFSPAIIISGAVFKIFLWAQVRLPPVSEYAKAWLLGTSRPFSLGSVLHDLNTSLIGRKWNDRRRLWLILLPPCAAFAWLMLKRFPSSEEVSIYSGLGFIQQRFMSQYYLGPLLILMSFISGLASFKIYDRFTRNEFGRQTNQKMILLYVAVLLTSMSLAFIECFVMLPIFVGFPIYLGFPEPCVDALKDRACTVSGAIDNSVIIISNLSFLLFILPIISLIFLSMLFITLVFVFPYVFILWETVSRNYFSRTDQKLALEKPLEFLAPVASLFSFLAISCIIIGVMAIK